MSRTQYLKQQNIKKLEIIQKIKSTEFISENFQDEFTEFQASYLEQYIAATYSMEQLQEIVLKVALKINSDIFPQDIDLNLLFLETLDLKVLENIPDIYFY